MELTRSHRAELLRKLKSANIELDAVVKIMSLPSVGEDHLAMEVDHYLIKERIRVIEEALIENQIDY